MSKNKNKTKSVPRNSIVVPMNLRNKTQIFADRREPKGGDKNEQRELLDIYDDDGSDCSQSFLQLEQSLNETEKQLAIKLNLVGDNVRQQLLVLDKNNNLVEDELVMMWHEQRTVYIDWVECNNKK
jgi:hypothetical protein